MLKGGRGMALFTGTAEAALMGVVRRVAPKATAIEHDPVRHLVAMTAVALQVTVCTRQREFCLTVVIEAPCRPCGRIVTEAAIGTEPAGVMLVLMTTSAGAGCVPERSRAMAFLARDRRMKSDQRKSRQIVIERDFASPSRLIVALSAVGPKLSLVRIVLAVAPDAGHRRLVTGGVVLVTGLAFGLRVRPKKGEAGRFSMIEADRAPVAGGVTCFAFRPQSTGVHVLNAVTTIASCFEPFVAFTGMAGVAGDLGMCSDQREPRFRMVERLDAAPCVLLVAALASRAKLGPVRIGTLVTIHTLLRGAAELRACEVAPFAWSRLVAAAKLEARESMVEDLAIKLNDIGVATLVLGMARTAVRL